MRFPYMDKNEICDSYESMNISQVIYKTGFKISGVIQNMIRQKIASNFWLLLLDDPAP